MDEEARKSLERLNEALGDQPYKVALVSTGDLVGVEKNARYMTNEMFLNLVDNIKKDGGLTSVPFCYLEKDGKYRVLSGNHRVDAAKVAGVEQILVLYTDQEMSHEEQVAVQISHNAIEGADDPKVLKELWDDIRDVNLKYYSGLDDKVLEELAKVELMSLAEVNLDFRTIAFMFLPTEAERLETVFKLAIEEGKRRDMSGARLTSLHVCFLEDFDRLIAAERKLQAAYNIRNSAVAMMLLLDIFERHQTDLAEGWENDEKTNRQWVPLASILGTDMVPAESAKVIKKAVERMRGREDVTDNNLWQALEYWAADYLAGE